MSAIRAIEQAVQPLSAHELAEFRQWVIEFDEAVLRDLQHNAYVAWHAERAKDHMLECWSDNAPSKVVFNQVGFTDLVNVAYVKAIKNFDTASDGLIKECAANMKAALAPTW